MAHELILRGPDEQERRLAGPDARLTLGRGAENDLPLDDPEVSRQHAILEATPTGFRLRDAESLSGTFLNGQRVLAAELAPGDELTLGRTRLTVVSLRKLPEAAPAPAPLPAPTEPVPAAARTSLGLPAILALLLLVGAVGGLAFLVLDRLTRPTPSPTPVPTGSPTGMPATGRPPATIRLPGSPGPEGPTLAELDRLPSAELLKTGREYAKAGRAAKQARDVPLAAAKLRVAKLCYNLLGERPGYTEIVNAEGVAVNMDYNSVKDEAFRLEMERLNRPSAPPTGAP